MKSKIDSLNNRIRSIDSEAENAKYLKESGVFQTLETDLEAAIVLQNELQTLKDSLKSKKNELEERVKKLKKSARDARKTLKKNKKPGKQSRIKKIQKEKSVAIGKFPGSRKKAIKSGKKPLKQKK